MLDFDVRKCTRKCAASGRDLRPGEKVFSTLVAEGGEVKRLDYSAEAWSGPPEQVISWWQFEIPEAAGGKVQWAPSDVIRNYFKALFDRDDEQDKRYILALLMVRRRMMRLEETETGERGVSELVLYCPKDEREYAVPVVEPSAERVKVIQDELADLLFGDGVPIEMTAAEPESSQAATENDPSLSQEAGQQPETSNEGADPDADAPLPESEPADAAETEDE